MTSRLKRKLNDIGVDTSSAKANENFCLIGTPLPPLDKTKDTGEFLPVWKQEVRDEKGRRRLHGAFTGGFSAGYFNTVGSAEGWTPSTFTSSRGDRAKAKKAKPEDFMDEEDLAELQESRTLVDTNEQMDVDAWNTGGKQGLNDEDESLSRALEAALSPPTRDSVGAQILRKMGWRLGQGVGPRITYAQRKAQDAMHGDTSSSLDDDDEAKKHMYPQRDTRVPNFKRKDDVFGVGYSASKGLSELVQGDLSNKVASGPNISAGFGLGALNDADDDDVDVYDGDVDKTRSRRQVAYEGEEDARVILNKTTESASIQRRPMPTNNPDVHVSGFFHDGTPVVMGFVVSQKPVEETRWFPLPKVPKDWVPNPSRVWEKDKENLGTDKQGQGTRMTVDERGKTLGETPLPSAPRSVFDYLSPKDRERLKNMSAGQVSAQHSGEKQQEPSITSSEDGPEPTVSDAASVPRLNPNVAKMALLGFQPYVADPVKHARYTSFLKAQAAGEDVVPFGRLPDQKEQEFAKELSDYAKSATIFKPVSATMSGRFTSAAVVQLGPTVKEGLYQPEQGTSLSNQPDDQSSAEKEKKEETPKENAARLGMYGPMTREVKTWLPSKLLCKRFGVKEPVVESREEESTAPTAGPSSVSKELLAITDASNANSSALVGEGTTEIGDEKVSFGSGRRDIANIGLGDDENQGRDILTYERPAMDIFKAIFASDDEDSDDEEQDKAVNDIDATNSPNTIVETSEEKDGLKVEKQEQDTKETKPHMTGVVVEEVDLTTFKPTFMPRSEKSKGKDKDMRDGVNSRKKSKRDKKGKSKTLMSFDVEEEGNERTQDERAQEHKRKKKRKEKISDDEGMWVEKPPPEAVQRFTGAPPLDDELDGTNPLGPARGRKRAIDFM